MKTIIFIVFLMLTLNGGFSQNLIELYKKGPVKLIPDSQFAQNNDWEEIFVSYYDTLYGKPMGNRKSIVLMPDGKVLVDHAYKDFYTLFDKNGKFIKEFGVTGKSGKRFKSVKGIHGIIDGNKFFTGLDNMGKMDIIDFNGNFIKNLTLDYMTKDIIPFGDDKIAVVGWVIWETKFRDFVAIVDYETNEQNIIWDHFTDRCKPAEHCKLFSYSYMFEKGGGFSMNTMPYNRSTGISAPPIIRTVNDKLVVSMPSTGEIFIFNKDGQKIAEDKIEWARNYLSVEEQKEIQRKTIEKFKIMESPRFASWVFPEENEKARTTMLKQMEEDLENITDPIPIPVISTIIKDSDGNLLFFEVPKEEGGNKFNVWIYREDGNFVCQSSFQCKDYNLSITPSKLVFRDRYVYGLQTLKNGEGNPLRLVRFKITGGL